MSINESRDWQGIVGKCFQPADFNDYVFGLSDDSLAWAKLVVVHNTQTPDLLEWAQKPGANWMRGLEAYYRDDKKWSAGPHLFVAPEGIWTFTPLTTPGVHSPSWNHCAWGVETVGDYSRELLPPATQENLTAALATLHERAGLDPATLKFHFEDPLTTHKGCPGVHMVKADVVSWVQNRLSPLVT